MGLRIPTPIVRGLRLRPVGGTGWGPSPSSKTEERKYDAQFAVVFDAIRELMAPQEESEQRKIGFRSDC